MPYNDDQLFYGALWFAASLDGAAAWVDDIFKAYGKKPMAIEPVSEPDHDYDGPPVTQEQFREFFDKLYQGLKDGWQRNDYAYSGKGNRYMELMHDRDNDPRPETEAVARVIMEMGLDKYMPRKYTRVYMQDTGEMFVNTKDANGRYAMRELDYPGKPQPGYKVLPRFSAADMKNTYKATWQSTQRVVPLEEGQTYVWKYDAVDGKSYQFDNQKAAKGDALTVSFGSSTVPLEELTDEEIIKAGPRVRVNNQRKLEEFTPGFESDYHRTWVEATADPRIVKENYGPITVMDVTEKIAIHTGGSFTIAEPGDKIILESENSTPRVMRKSIFDSGALKLFPYNEKPAPPGAVPKPKGP